MRIALTTGIVTSFDERRKPIYGVSPGYIPSTTIKAFTLANRGKILNCSKDDTIVRLEISEGNTRDLRILHCLRDRKSKG